MQYLPWKAFPRIVACYGGDLRVRNLNSAQQSHAMAFAQLTGRNSLRPLTACRGAVPTKLYHAGLTAQIHVSTLAPANERRAWPMHADRAQRLIARARAFYADEDLGLELDATVYALDSSTVTGAFPCSPGPPSGPPRQSSYSTRCELTWGHPVFVYVSDGKLDDLNVLDLLVPEPSGIFVMDRPTLSSNVSTPCIRPERPSSPERSRTSTTIVSTPLPRTANAASWPLRPLHWTGHAPSRPVLCTCGVSATATPSPASCSSSSPTAPISPQSRCALCIRVAGRPNSSFAESRAIGRSNASSARPRMPSSRKSGSPSRSMPWLRSFAWSWESAFPLHTLPEILSVMPLEPVPLYDASTSSEYHPEPIASAQRLNLFDV